MKKNLKKQTHVGISHNTRRVAITLAEVLITLGIIGIVSAMTIPTLLSNYQKKALDNHFKKSFSVLNQALLMTLSNYDYIPKCYYKSSGYLGSDCRTFLPDFFSKLRVSKHCVNKALENGCIPEYKGLEEVYDDLYPDKEHPDGYDSYGDYQATSCGYWRKNEIHNRRQAWVLNDGTIIFDYFSSMPIFALDVNGFEGPNKWGHDIFSFRLHYNGSKFRVLEGSCLQPEKGGVTTYSKMKELGFR